MAIRINISLPPEVMGNLDRVSRSLGVSRSSCVAVLIEEPLEHLVEVLGALPLEDGEAPRRYRGLSIGSIRRRISEQLQGRSFLEVNVRQGGGE